MCSELIFQLLEAQELDHLHHGPHDDQEELLDDEDAVTPVRKRASIVKMSVIPLLRERKLKKGTFLRLHFKILIGIIKIYISNGYRRILGCMVLKFVRQSLRMVTLMT